MEHLSSRFRRTSRSRKDGASAAAPAPLVVPPRSATSDRLAPSFHDSPQLHHPVLTITTAATTPPRSSHSIQSAPGLFNAPKSPFRGFHLRSSNKRARSPAPASLPTPSSPVVVHHDGSVEQDMTSPATNRPIQKGDDGQKAEIREQPKIPAFLAMSEQDIVAKYQEITWIERNRLLQAFTHPEPTFKFARVDSAFRILDRYANIQPWNNNRVKLNVPEGATDYINASPIILKSPLNETARPPHRYIAMQGPRGNTQEHAWRMVAEQLTSPAVIVMLTETHEALVEKCFPYYPQKVDDVVEIGEADEFNDGFRAQAKCLAVEEKADGAIELRKISLHIEGREEDMEVWHLLYKRWPDFGVPALEDIDSFFELMRLSRLKNATEDNPRIVHCSAGVGRSGTFIALEHLIRELDSGDLQRYDEVHGSAAGPEPADLVFDTVNALREQRKMMVQSEPQFLFIYQVLRKLWFEKYGVQDENGEPAAKRLGLDLDPFVESA